MSLRDILRMLFGGNSPPPPPPPTLPPPPPPPAPDPGGHKSLMLRTLIDLHNKTRSAYDLDPLEFDFRLAEAAAKHAAWMASHGVLSHTGDGGSTVSRRVSATGYRWQGVGENIAAGQRTAESVMKAWMSSPGHKANILGNYKHFGVSFEAEASGRLFWCVVFARPPLAKAGSVVVEEVEVHTLEGIWAPVEG